MTEQLYRIERRRAKTGEMFSCDSYSGTLDEVSVLVPVPEVRDLAWGVGEMVRHEGNAYRGGTGLAQRRFNQGVFQRRISHTDAWVSWNLFCAEEQSSTSWHACDERPAIGSEAWLRSLPDGATVRDPNEQMYYEKRGEVLFPFFLDGKQPPNFYTLSIVGCGGLGFEPYTPETLEPAINPLPDSPQDATNATILSRLAALEQRVAMMEGK